eukprot:TRINITY_DN1230_c0_g1_i3.p1 TRINITY_DN1230_c0_g1~~TRINITY_DN1230_c0_g1_i3.p1  ORF type:complete len:262 (+),score=50.55 TRINITY_DN1230_c0_g1_i3:3-788(+)
MYIDFFFFQAEDGIRDAQESRGLGDVYKRQIMSNDFKAYQKKYSSSKQTFFSDIVEIGIVWSTIYQQREMVGFHTMYLKAVEDNDKLVRTSFSGSSKETFPLTVKVEGPNQMKHDFSQVPFLTVEVAVKIRNKRANAVTFCLEAVDSDEKFLQQTQNNQDEASRLDSKQINDPLFLWEGKKKFCFSQLTQDRCEVVQLKATFFRGGFYDLNRFKFQFFKDKITKREILNLDVVDTEDVETTDYLSSEEQYFFEVIDTQRSP